MSFGLKTDVPRIGQRSTRLASDNVIDLRTPVASVTAVPSDALPVDIGRLRMYRLYALIALVVLNAFDLITTRAFLNAGAAEGNPLSDALIGKGVMPYAKGAILLGLGFSVLRSKPKLSTTCAMWFVVGVYTTAIVVNLMVLAQVS